MTTPTIHLHTTATSDAYGPFAEISVNGVLRRYRFLTGAEVDTVKFLFRKASGLKALNFAKHHSEADEMVEP